MAFCHFQTSEIVLAQFRDFADGKYFIMVPINFICKNKRRNEVNWLEHAKRFDYIFFY